VTQAAPQASLGQRIRAWRKRRKLNQGQLAEKVGVSGRRTIIRWEKDIDVPTPENRKKLAQVLKASRMEFEPNEDEKLTPLYRQMEKRLEELEGVVGDLREDVDVLRTLVEDQLSRLRQERDAR
jgi:transcriptional regulator with XRE-family HTH domain